MRTEGKKQCFFPFALYSGEFRKSTEQFYSI